MNATAAIRADALTRAFGERVAVNAVSFDVAPGEIFGFLGPNGAGKSTTARMLGAVAIGVASLFPRLSVRGVPVAGPWLRFQSTDVASFRRGPRGQEWPHEETSH